LPLHLVMEKRKYHPAGALKIINLVILLLGLGGAWWVYQTADEVPSGVIGYEQENGERYPVLAGDSK